MIVLYHFQYDMFGGSFLVDRGQGFVSWISNSFGYISQEPSAWPGLFMSLLFIGVNIFFVLSGYGLMMKYKNKKSVNLKSMQGQILKILIPFWLAHPIIHILDWVLKNLQYYAGFINYQTYFSGMHSVSQYFESMLVIPKWFSEQGALSFVGTWWFVGIIIQFYLIFPILFRLFKKYNPLYVFVWCVAISLLFRFIISLTTGAAPIGTNEANILLFIVFPARLSEFALGAFMAVNMQFFKKLNLWICGLLIILGFIFLGNVYLMFSSDFLFALGGIFVLIAITKHLKGPAEKIFSYIGKKSYLIYLYHEPTMKLILKFIFPNWINS